VQQKVHQADAYSSDGADVITASNGPLRFSILSRFAGETVMLAKVVQLLLDAAGCAAGVGFTPWYQVEVWPLPTLYTPIGSSLFALQDSNLPAL
jgi:hypothetical protein